MSTVVVLQPGEETNSKSLRALIQASHELKAIYSDTSSSDFILLGSGEKSRSLLEEISLYGFTKAILLTEIAEDEYTSVTLARNVAKIIEDIDGKVIVYAASSSGKDIAPRVASLLNAGQASEIVAVNSDGTLRRPLFAGDLLADIEILSERKVVTVRTSAFDGEKLEKGTSPIAIQEIPAESFMSPTRFARIENTQVAVLDRPELGDASRVVSGGRALQSAENFKKLIFPLAEVLGAAVGASRAAVDAGFAPNDWQVGQTGKVVAPELYIAIGISGAIQHLAGMKDSKVIVAINKDGDAPIFQVADYALVGDLFSLVPELTERLKSRNA